MKVSDLIELIIASSLKSTAAEIPDEFRSPRVKDENRTIYGMFYPTDRFVVDFAPDFNDGGWHQMSSRQDAHYFGVWYSEKQKMILNYAEGDWSVVVCKTEESYIQEFNEATEFYRKQFA